MGVAANSYVEQVKQTPVWYDYFANPGSTVYVYKTQNVDDTIVKTYTSRSRFQVDVNNMRQDQNGYFWAPVADDTGKELGYTDLSAAHAGSKSAAIPLVYCQSGWMPAYVLAEEGMDVLAAPNDAAALVKHMDRDAYFWFGVDETYTDAKGKIWTRIYASKDYEEMADGGWVRLNDGVNYTTVYGECSYTGRSISRNGITYTLYGGYNSWGGASSWFSDGIDFNDGTAVRKHLAIVHNDAEQAIIEQLLNATSTIDKAWIGASNTSGAWKWLDGTNVQYSQWGYNEPSGTGTGLGAAASFDGSWYAHDDYLDIHVQGFITEQFTGIGLPQVKLPTSTFYVDDEAFVGNSTIQSVVAPDGLQVIGTRAFADCANLKCISPAGLRVPHRGGCVREHAGCRHLCQRRQLRVAVGGEAGHPARHAVHRVKSVGADFPSGRSAPLFAGKIVASRKKSAQSPLTNRFPCATISLFEAEACPSLTLRGVCCRVHRLFPFQAD